MCPEGDRNFPTTSWTLIARIKSGDESVAARALDEICSQYHYPLYCYIRRRGLEHHDAEDALHDFLARLLRKGTFEGADAEKGHLRSLLAASLSRFLINRHRDSHRERLTVSMDAEAGAARERYEKERFSGKDTPDIVFERKWAHELMRHVLKRLRARQVERNRLEIFRALRPALLDGGTLRGQDVASLAAAQGMSENALRAAFSRLLREYGEVLESEVRQTVTHPDEVGPEIDHLVQLLGTR